MPSSDVLFEVNEKGIAVLTFNRPDRFNALTVIIKYFFNKAEN